MVKQARSTDVNSTWSQPTTSTTICVINEARKGMFITTYIHGVDVRLLIDTGAMITILSTRTYRKINHLGEQRLQNTNIKLKQADGAAVMVYGVITLDMNLGHTCLPTTFVVADIQNDGILGMDVLLKTQSTIDCNNLELRINGEVIPCTDVSGEYLPIRQVDVKTTMPPEVPEFLHDLFQRTTTNLDDVDSPKIVSLLSHYSDVFSQGDHDIGRTNRVKHSIHTTCPAPIRQKPRRPPMGQRDEIDKQINDMLARGIIQPSSSPWASPIVLVDKKDGTKRFCVDYRLLNQNTVKDSFPLPRIDESIDSLDGAKYFCTLDLASGYWQVPLDDNAKLKSAFIVPGGLFQFEVMPFGLCNAPSTFERLMEQVLSGLQWKILVVYLDDVIVYGPTVNEVLARLELVLQRLRGAQLKLKPKKCHLFKREVLYLGHVVSEHGVATDPTKIETVKNWPQPKTQTDVRSFLGLASYYRKYIKGFSTIAKPLTGLTEKNQAFIWSPECEHALQTLKEKLITAPILAYPKPGQPFILDTDASNFGIGAVLSQEHDGHERVTAYASRTLNKAERNYCVTRRELLAIVTFLKKFRHYLYGHEVLVRTDHGALRWLMNFKDPEGQLARWLEIISRFRLTLQHRAGRIHMNADGLSRRPCTQCGQPNDVCKEKQ